MATVDTHTTERRHIPDRRANSRNASNTNSMTAMGWVAMALLIIGGINWGLIGLFSFNLVGAIFGGLNPLTRIIYLVVGLCALYAIYMSSKMARKTR